MGAQRKPPTQVTPRHTYKPRYTANTHTRASGETGRLCVSDPSLALAGLEEVWLAGGKEL